MEREGADFVFTGEVLGQRPKSQRRDTLRIIEREARMDGRLLRPALGEAAEAHHPGGGGAHRSRAAPRRQRPRAHTARSRSPGSWGSTDWPQPAGGCCFLTDESFSRKFFDLLAAREAAGEGRHISHGGGHPPHRRPPLPALAPRQAHRRAERDGERPARAPRGGRRARLEAPGVTGPVALVEGAPSPEDRQLAASIVARYGKAQDEPRVHGRVARGGPGRAAGGRAGARRGAARGDADSSGPTRPPRLPPHWGCESRHVGAHVLRRKLRLRADAHIWLRPVARIPRTPCIAAVPIPASRLLQRRPPAASATPQTPIATLQAEVKGWLRSASIPSAVGQPRAIAT